MSHLSLETAPTGSLHIFALHHTVSNPVMHMLEHLFASPGGDQASHQDLAV